MTEYEIRLIKTGKQLRAIGSAKDFMDYINSFIEERTYILRDKLVTLKEERQWMKNEMKILDEKNVLKVILLAERKIVGIAEARKGSMKEKYNVSFGLLIAKEHRGKGYGKLLLKTAISEAKKYLKPHKMWIKYIANNSPAQKLYKSLGFVEVARLKDYVNHFGKWCDKILMEYKK